MVNLEIHRKKKQVQYINHTPHTNRTVCSSSVYVSTCIQQTNWFSENMNFESKSFDPSTQTVIPFCMATRGKTYDSCTACFLFAGLLNVVIHVLKFKRIKSEIKINLLLIICWGRWGKPILKDNFFSNL